MEREEERESGGPIEWSTSRMNLYLDGVRGWERPRDRRQRISDNDRSIASSCIIGLRLLLLIFYYLACNHFYHDGLVSFSYDDRQTCRCDENWSRVLAIRKQDKSSAGKVARSFSSLCEVENIIQ
jgi:hypothetical protein